MNSIERNRLVPKVAVVALSSPLEVGAGRARGKALELAATLKGERCEALLAATASTPGEAAALGRQLAGLSPDMVVFLPVCWFEDYLVTDFIEECPAPLLLWALPGMETGSLCGCQQLGALLSYLGHPFSHVFGEAGDQGVAREALRCFRAAALRSRLRRARIGMIGSRVNGMTHTSPNEFMLKKSLGPRVVPIPPGKLASQADGQEVQELWAAFKGRCGAVNVEDAGGLESMRMYRALKGVVDEHALDALTVGCYPDLMGKVCVAAALLAEEGVPLACEGDVNGAAAQLILTLLSGSPTCNADFLEPYDDDSIIFSHCGSSSLSLARGKDEVSLNSARLMGQGVCALFPARPGKVTLLNLTAREDGYQVAMLPGEALAVEMVFPGNPARVKFGRPAKEVIDWTFREGMGHHWMMAYGDHVEEIRAWAKLARKLFVFKENQEAYKELS